MWFKSFLRDMNIFVLLNNILSDVVTNNRGLATISRGVPHSISNIYFKNSETDIKKMAYQEKLLM